MLQMATGAIDSAGIPGSINGESTAAGISMSLGAIIKRHKRTLINFQESFIIPFVEKAAWRYMQFDPEHYPVKDYNFIASSTLGIIAREYEVTQLVQLLQTMGQDSPLYPVLIKSVIDNMSLSNREEMKAALDQASQPSPEAQQQAQSAFQMDMRRKEAEVSVFESQAAESGARAEKYREETRLLPIKTALENLPEDDDDKNFRKRLEIADRQLKERDIAVKETKGPR